MKTILLATIALILATINLKAQADTVSFLNGTTSVGLVKTISNDFLKLSIQGSDFTYPLNMITKLVISDSNPNKKALENSYMAFLNKIQITKPIAPLQNFNAAYYLKRGANKQLAGIFIVLGSGVLGGTIMALSEKPTTGAVIAGAGTLIGFAFTVSGISDIKQAGLLLDHGNIGSYQDNK